MVDMTGSADDDMLVIIHSCECLIQGRT
jgi:hypothetical protein